MAAQQFFIKTTDTPPTLQAQLINVDGNYNPVSNVNNIKMNVSGKGRLLLQATGITIIDSVHAKVQYIFTTSILNTLGVGIFDVEFQVTYNDMTVQTFPNDNDEIQLVIT